MTDTRLRAALAQALSDEVLIHAWAAAVEPYDEGDWPTCDNRSDMRAVLLEALLPALAAPAWQPPTRDERDKAQWTLDNIYTVARRELRKMERLSYTDEERDGWRHVIRLCEKVGCQGRGVLRDNGGSLDAPAPPPRGPEEG